MAHIQYYDKSISGQTLNIPLGNSLIVEVWGPWNGPDGEFVLVSSNPSAVTVEPQKPLAWKNTRPYKLTAKSFGPLVNVAIYPGALLDEKRSNYSSAVSAGSTPGYSITINVQPTASKGPYSDYFREVIPAIAAGIAEFNSGKGSEKLINKAGFLLVQTWGEQSPATTGRPSKNGNRMFNVQALCTRNSDNKITGVVPGQEEEGVTILALSQGEGASDASRVKLSSPTFNYDTPKRAVTHYLKVLSTRYKSAYTTITQERSSFFTFVTDLKNARYATDETYHTTMKEHVPLVFREAKAWLEYRIQTLDHDISMAIEGADVGTLKSERTMLEKFKSELKAFVL